MSANAPTPVDSLVLSALRAMERATASVSGALAELRADKQGPGQVHITRHIVSTNNAIDEGISFKATAVCVDNYSTQHCWVDAAGAWAVPLARGQVFPLAGTNRAKSRVEAVPGRADPAATAGENIVLTWLERWVSIASIRDL